MINYTRVRISMSIDSYSCIIEGNNAARVCDDWDTPKWSLTQKFPILGSVIRLEASVTTKFYDTLD